MKNSQKRERTRKENPSYISCLPVDIQAIGTLVSYQQDALTELSLTWQYRFLKHHCHLLTTDKIPFGGILIKHALNWEITPECTKSKLVILVQWSFCYFKWTIYIFTTFNCIVWVLLWRCFSALLRSSASWTLRPVMRWVFFSMSSPKSSKTSFTFFSNRRTEKEWKNQDQDILPLTMDKRRAIYNLHVCFTMGIIQIIGSRINFISEYDCYPKVWARGKKRRILMQPHYL